VHKPEEEEEVMNSSSDSHAPTAPQPTRGEPPTQPQVNLQLGTSVSGNTITITGDNSTKPLQTNQAATHFNFTLNDTSGANVKFDSLDAQDNSSSCPPTVTGNQSGQIVGITTNNASPNNKSARFTDNNDNNAANGVLNISYQWNFTCDPPYSVRPFDPIISNGGKTGPV
jgi:hypothetical protein